jgi:hypothetical protein
VIRLSKKEKSHTKCKKGRISSAGYDIVFALVLGSREKQSKREYKLREDTKERIDWIAMEWTLI